MRVLLLSLFLFTAITTVSGQTNECYESLLQKGKIQFNAGNYDKAIVKWTGALECPDLTADNRDTLNSWIAKAQHPPKQISSVPTTPSILNYETEKNLLFPSDGVTLGITTVKELAKLGYRAARIDKNTKDYYLYYVINNTNVWYNGVTNIADSYYLLYYDYLPNKWRLLGMDWGKSYNEWINWAKQLGLKIESIKKPIIEKYEGHDSFSAKLKLSYIAEKITYNVILEFDYSEGKSINDKNTLYSIKVSAY